MSNDGTKPERPWRDIAEELSKEHDENRVAELTQELIERLWTMKALSQIRSRNRMSNGHEGRLHSACAQNHTHIC